MNKHVIIFFTVVFGFIGSYIPMLLGDKDIFSLWGILGGIIGGIFGVWFGVMICKRYL